MGSACELASPLGSLLVRTLVLADQGWTFMTSFDPNYLCKGLSPNTGILGVGLQHKNLGEDILEILTHSMVRLTLGISFISDFALGILKCVKTYKTASLPASLFLDETRKESGGRGSLPCALAFPHSSGDEWGLLTGPWKPRAAPWLPANEAGLLMPPP